MVLGFVACDGICAFYKYAENTTCFNVGVHGDHLVSESNHVGLDSASVYRTG